MSQFNPLVIANKSFPATRSDINDALQAVGSNNSFPTEPATKYANMFWYDETAHILKMRSELNDAWISIGYLDQSSNTFKILDDTVVTTADGLTDAGLLGDQATATWETGTGTTESLVSPAKVKASVIANAPSSSLSFQTPVTTTSGTIVDFGGIPSTATEVNIYWVNYRQNGTSRVQLKVSGTAIITGYAASSGTSGGEVAATDGFNIYNDSTSRVQKGMMTLHRISSSTWVESHSISLGGADANGGGNITGVGTVDGIRVTTTGAFLAGQVSVSWR